MRSGNERFKVYMENPSSYVHNLSSAKRKPEQNLGLNRFRTYDLATTGAVLYQLSSQLATSFPGSLFFPSLGGPGNEVGQLGAGHYVSFQLHPKRT